MKKCVLFIIFSILLILAIGIKSLNQKKIKHDSIEVKENIEYDNNQESAIENTSDIVDNNENKKEDVLDGSSVNKNDKNINKPKKDQVPVNNTAVESSYDSNLPLTNDNIESSNNNMQENINDNNSQKENSSNSSNENTTPKDNLNNSEVDLKEKNIILQSPPKKEEAWEKLGKTKEQYYNEPMYKWQRVDFKSSFECHKYGDNYEPYLKGEETYHCRLILSAAGKYLGVMFQTEKINEDNQN